MKKTIRFQKPASWVESLVITDWVILQLSVALTMLLVDIRIRFNEWQYKLFFQLLGVNLNEYNQPKPQAATSSESEEFSFEAPDRGNGYSTAFSSLCVNIVFVSYSSTSRNASPNGIMEIKSKCCYSFWIYSHAFMDRFARQYL